MLFHTCKIWLREPFFLKSQSNLSGTLLKVGLLWCAVFFISSCFAQTQTITTLAGNGTPGHTGNGGSSTAAQLNSPMGLASDPAGNIYIADRNNRCIRKITPSGTITTVAGDGTNVYIGDGSLATATGIGSCLDVTLDVYGNMFIGTSKYVFKVNPSGVITTVAGKGVSGYGGNGGPATAATLTAASGVAADASGNVYFADETNYCIRKVNASGIISTIAGNGSPGYGGDGGPAASAKFGQLTDIALDGAGNLYICDGTNYRVRKINTSGVITTIAGNGSAGYSPDGTIATAGAIGPASGVSADNSGNIFLTFGSGHRIRKVNSAGVVTTIAGNSGVAGYTGDFCSATAAQMKAPTGIAAGNSGVIYFVDSVTHTVRKIFPNHAPKFFQGHNQSMNVCNNSMGVDISSMLAIIDSDLGQAETWGVYSTPLHGSVTFTYSGTSTGDTVIPSFIYRPASGYAGNDSFKVRIADCVNGADTTVVHVVISAAPNAGAITGDSTVCSAGSVTLSDAVAGGTWGVSNSTLAYVINGVVTTSMSGSVTVLYWVSNAMCSDTARDTITIFPVPSAGTISGLHTICKGSTTILTNTVAGEWSSGDVLIATIGSSTGMITGVNEGTAVITFAPPPSNGCTAQTTFLLTVVPAPTFTVTGSVTQVSCYGENSGSITISTAGVGPFKNSWYNGDSSATIHNLAAGTYSVTVTEVSTQCAVSKSYDVTRPDSMQIEPLITKDRCNNSIGSVSISVSGGVSPYSYHWSNSNTSTKITGLPAGSYTVTVTDANGCKKKQAMAVAEDTCNAIVVFDVITPNGDGINDTWVINGLFNYPQNVVQIFDKYGDVVYEQSNYNNDWSGKASTGVALPDGTYYYLIKLNGVNPLGKDVLTGTILIKR